MVDISKGINPETVAVIGASNHPEKIGYQIVANLIQDSFQGKVFPVNPKGGEILGLTVAKSLGEIREPIDLVVIVIPRKFVKQTVIECIDNGIKNIVIISAGFSEVSVEGKSEEQEIADLCKKNDVMLIGPNCLGIMNTDISLNATFAKGMPKSGCVSLFSQSGAIISSMISLSYDAAIGYSKIFSLGNKALVGEADILNFLYGDEKTKVIVGYIESLSVTDDLTKSLISGAKKKPTIILFGGKSAYGAKAAASHTGSVISSYLAIKTYLEQAGVILATNLEDLLIKSKIFSAYSEINGGHVAIVTNAGGPSIAASDALSAAKLSMSNLTEETRDSLREKLRPEASVMNPVDLLGDASPDDYRNAIDIVSKDPNVDSILLLLTPQTATKIEESAQIVADYRGNKPIVSSFVGGEILTSAKGIIENSGKPCYSYPEEAVEAITSLVAFANAPQSIHLPVKCTKKFEEEKRDEILAGLDLPVVLYQKFTREDGLCEAARKLGYPVVVKVDDKSGHKSDGGGVAVDLKGDADLLASANKIGFPLILGKMISGKYELLLGIKKDANIGTSVLFGTGGIFSEIYADFAFAIAPISVDKAKEMILSTKIGEILNGARGQKEYDLDELAKLIVKAAEFADEYCNISEIDFNPIIVSAAGYHMVDVRIITAK